MPVLQPLLTAGLLSSSLLSGPYLGTAGIATRVINSPATLKVSQLSAGGVENSILTPTLSQSVVSAPIVSRIWKREADAEADAEADPSLILNNGLISPLGLNGYTTAGVISPLALNTRIVSTGLTGYAIGATNTPVVTGIAASPLISALGGRIWKREAEAEAGPGLISTGLLGSTLLGSPLIGTPLAAAPLAYRTPLLRTTIASQVINTPTTLKESQVAPGGVENSILTPTISQSIVNTPIVSRIWKREADAEADAEADPSLILNNGLVAPLGLGYSTAGLINPLGLATPASTVLAGRTIIAAPRTVIGTTLVRSSPLLTSTIVGSPVVGAPIW